MLLLLDSLVDNSAKATALDHELRFLMTADVRVQRAIGAILLRLKRPELMKLGYSQRSDYVREHAGISLRQAEQLAATERDIVNFRETEDHWNANIINTCHVREIVRSGKPDGDGVNACLATIMTVRQLIVWLVGEQAIESEDGETLEFRLDAEGRSDFERCHELGCRLWERNISPAELLDTCTAELIAAVDRRIVTEALDDVLLPCPWKPDFAKMRADAEKAAERKMARWKELQGEQACTPDFTVPADADVWALDEGLERAVEFQQELNSLVVRKLLAAWRMDIHDYKQCANFTQYCREKLGLSRTRAFDLLRLGRRLEQCPAVRDVYATGILSQCKAEQIARVATAQTAKKWIECAERVTVRKRQALVRSALAMRESEGIQHVLPPSPPVCTSPAAQALIDEGLERIGAGVRTYASPALPYPQVLDSGALPDYSKGCRMRIPMESSIHEHVGLGLRAANLLRGGDAPKYQCVSLLIQYLLKSYADEARKAAKEHSVPERDGWVCQVPGCSRRAQFAVHHIVCKSHGGSNKKPNLITLCSAHHHHGIHAGYIVVRGEAPHNVPWWLGVQPDGTPNEVFLGDWRVAIRTTG